MDALSNLINALRALPGVGPKSAQRMAYSLLQNKRDRGLHLALCLEKAMLNIQNCERCNNFTEKDLCVICEDKERDNASICVVAIGKMKIK